MNFNHTLEAFNRISEEKRNKIFDAAINEFAEHGYESANINNIALKAEVSIGSMYKYFKNKEELYLAIIHFGVESLKGILEEIICSEEDLLGKIEKIIRVIQSYSRSNVNLTKLYNQMTNENHSGLVWEIVSDMEGVTAKLYASFIKEAKDAGKVRNDVDEKLFAYFLDNLFILLQFSYSCEYYKERLKMFVSEDIFDKDDLVAEQLMKFIRGAFFLE
ncbi:MAG: Transcriptional regulator, AcrR-family [Clostridiales bacterium]|jgi:AcrR family transcriptional regulator|nr:Transcriptional regulator, AcrR-family [Clostridiales bacterium]